MKFQEPDEGSLCGILGIIRVFLGEIISFKASRRGELSSLDFRQSLASGLCSSTKRTRGGARARFSNSGWKSGQGRKGILKRGEREGREEAY